MNRSTDLRKFLSAEEAERVTDCIGRAESGTSAEIKLVILRHCWTDIRDKAGQLFKKMRLAETAERNCVMFLVVVANREFLVYGDIGIHRKVGQSFWDDVRNIMANAFRENRRGDAICDGMRLAGERLAEHFPRREDDTDEIPDDIVYEN